MYSKTYDIGILMNCPNCQKSEHVFCLAGGLALNELSEAPYYCMSCKMRFEAAKKEVEPWSKYLNFEVKVPEKEASTNIQKNYPVRMGFRQLLKH